MSQRVKKPGRSEETQGKRRRRRPSGSDGDEDGTRSGSNSGGNGSLSGMWTPRHLGDLKVSSIYNRNSAEAPAELYRKDLISAMKLADSEPLTPEEYWLITDPWKQEWEKGVQVPVNPESLPEPEVNEIIPVAERSHDFRLPKNKYVRVTNDDFFNPDFHQLVSTAARAEKVCSYDLDDVDAAWLGCSNADRGMQTFPAISEFLMEQVIEELELQCWEQVQTILKSQEGLGIEYDENVICDVCRSPESEEGNEMVFCDSCNICVHQACYGITTIPSGSWLCRTCSLSIRPSCVLCPNVGGAMKATRSGHKWAHVACAIWIPEVSIGSVEKMEPITKISAIPQSRWSLLCVICKDKVGACIQCSVKTCKTAYHVTCAFKSGLEMKPIIVDENAEDGIKLRSYCQKHSVNTTKDKSTNSGSEEDGERKKTRAMTAEERNQARAEKLQQIESEFFKYVRLKDVSQNLAVDMDIVNLIFNYWKLKRKSLNNRPLVPPRPETTQLLTQQQEKDLEQMKMYIQLRQDLERVRNLCYMVSRREKLSRSYFKLREQTFQKQVAVLTDKSADSLIGTERDAVVEANHGPNIYDRLYSHNGAASTYADYDSLVSLIIGRDGKPDLVNGIVKPGKVTKKKANSVNPYKKTFVNGSRRRNLMGESCSSLSESDGNCAAAAAQKPPVTVPTKPAPSTSTRRPLSYLFDTDSSMDAVIISNSTTRKGAPKGKKGAKGKATKKGKSLVKSSSSDSDDLQLPGSKEAGAIMKRDSGPIYSDTDSETNNTKGVVSTAATVATKGALKEFAKNKRRGRAPAAAVAARKAPAKGKGRGPGKKKNKAGLDPNEMIVPQREAAKKASESIKTVKQLKGKDIGGVAREGSESPGPSTTAKDLLTLGPVQTIKESNKLRAREIETLSDSEVKFVSLPKKKIPEKKTKNKKRPAVSKREATSTNSISLTAGLIDSKDEYYFDDLNLNDEARGKSVSYVPQRQAAKKAAEHIRSGLSNIVAARLIIEDEMEAARKKSKIDRSGRPSKSNTADTDSSKSPTRLLRLKSSSPSTYDLTAREKGADDLQSTKTKSRKQKDTGKCLLKGDGARSGGKIGKRDVGKSPSKEGTTKDKDTDWPFLDKGSQSACRRSREQSSSSSSSSSGSSSSNRSSSSSRSSSPESASPDPNKSKKQSSPAKSTQISSISTGPGRKLKTSERCSIPGSRAKTPQRAKPSPTRGGPAKSGPGRGAVRGSRSSSPLQPIPTSRRESVSTTSQQQHNFSTSSSGSHSSRFGANESLSSSRLLNNSPAKDKSPQAKSPRRNREPKICQNEKEPQSTTQSHKQTRASPKALEKTELDLSSESEPEIKPKSEVPAKVKSRNPSRSPISQVSSSMGPGATPPTDSDKNKEMQKREKKKKEVSMLSETDSSGADEKENSCGASGGTSGVTQSHSQDAESPRKTPAQKQNVPASLSVLSPLSSDNKDSASRPPDATEPESKRARIDSSHAHSSSTQSSELLVTKSIFSPPGPGRESELLDFDTDLYDLERSVTDEYGETEEGGPSSVSVTFSFPHDSTCREDNKEDSAMATFNLVEKLRLQHLRKSGAPNRPSIDGNSGDEADQRDSESLQTVRDEKICESESKAAIPTNSSEEALKSGLELSNKSPTVVSSESPDRSKSIQGDERWVPPSSTSGFHPESRTPNRVSSSNTTVIEEKVKPEKLSKVESSPHRAESLQSHEQHYYNPHLPLNIQSMPVTVHEQLKSQSNGLPTSSGGLNIGLTLTPSLGFMHGSVPPSFLPRGHGPPFIYPINSSLANVVTSLANVNSLPFYHTPNHPPQINLPNSSPNVSATSTLTMTIPTPLSTPPSLSYPSSFNPHFISTSTHLSSPSLQKQPSPRPQSRRKPPTDIITSMPNSLGSGVSSSGMPPLSKPPLTSPSLLLSATNAKTMTPPPPPQSTVAQIIESVIHASNNHGVGGAIFSAAGFQPPKIKMFVGNLGMNINVPASSITVTSTNQSPAALAVNETSHVIKHECPNPITPFQSKPAHSEAVPVSDFSAILSNRTTENIIPPKALAPRDNHVVPVPLSNVVSPKGHGSRSRRSTTPRIKTEKVVVAEEVSPRARGRGERKTSGTTPRRGGGHGRSKGRNVVGVRKDLAGTVYDIDFDEFEENSEEKIDLRMLRERRKSNDIHDNRKSESSNASPAHTEILSPRYRSSFESDNSGVCRGDKIPPILHTPLLPGPVDMRTYNSIPDIRGNEAMGSIRGFPHSKDPSALEIASLFMEKAAHAVNEMEQLDKTLEALSAVTKSQPPLSVNRILHLNSVVGSHQKYSQAALLIPGGDSSLSSSKDSDTPSIVTSMSDDKDSRNQLKVKIKGPFLDANYSSHHSISQAPGGSTFQPPYHPTEPMNPMMMNVTPMLNNTSSLRRMRKKELLRQYWTQDMNMDGSSLNLPYGAEFGVVPTNPIPHPINRSVITIPKAVASMGIIPTNDDYQFDPMTGFDSNVPPPPSECPTLDKKKRSRGFSREVAALGILPTDGGNRERRRDRLVAEVAEANSRKKRPKAEAPKPSRSAFIPPTLIDADGRTPSISTSFSSFNPLSTNQSSGVVSAVNHPTPKLKIKFADFVNSSAKANVTSSIVSTNNNSDTEKETPNKKIKGKPPKKRGLPEQVETLPAMEELKRQSLKFREMVMQDFVAAEKRENLNVKGSRKAKKKHRNKKGESGDTDASNRSKSPEVKVISDGIGPKLILRFNKNRTASTSTESSTSGVKDTCGETKSKENGPGLQNSHSDTDMPVLERCAENDSGFTGSSEGSTGGGPALDVYSSNFKNLKIPILQNSKETPLVTENSDSITDETVKIGKVSACVTGASSSTFVPTQSQRNPCSIIASSNSSTSPSTKVIEKLMPIRLKLSRCYEGYALKNKKNEAAVENSTPKPNDSCEVR